MTVPKAAVNKNYLFKLMKDDIGISGQFILMYPKSIPHSMDNRANDKFRGRVITMNATHNNASLFRRKYVRHSMRAAL